MVGMRTGGISPATPYRVKSFFWSGDRPTGFIVLKISWISGMRTTPIQRAFNTSKAFGGKMKINACGMDIGVPHKNLNSSQISIILKEMSSKAVAERMYGNGF